MAAIPTRRFVSITASIVAFAVLAGWAWFTWDAYVTNFQVRVMCNEERPFIIRRGENAEALALPDEAVQGDPRVMQVFSEAFPTVAAASTPEGRAAPYGLVELWPRAVRNYWAYAVVRTELSVVSRPDGRAMGTIGLYRRVTKRNQPFAELRARLAPPPELCTPADRLDFVKRVIKPPA